MLPKNKNKILPTEGSQRGLSRETINLFKFDVLGISPQDELVEQWISWKSSQQSDSRKLAIATIRKNISGDPAECALLEYQKDWIQDDSRQKLGDKSRRIGLTYAEALDAVLTASLEKSEGGSNHLYVSTREQLTKEFIDTSKEWAEILLGYPCIPAEEDCWDDSGRPFKALTIEFPSGFKLYALSSNPANLRGLQGNVCIDEAAHHKDLSELLKAAKAMSMWGGKLRIISTHKGKENEFNKLIIAGKFSHHKITIVDAYNQGLARRILTLTNQDNSPEAQEQWLNQIIEEHGNDAAEELFCEPSESLAAYFDYAAVIRATRLEYTVLEFACDNDFITLPEKDQEVIVDGWIINTVEPILKELAKDTRQCFAGLDFGRINDLTSLSIILTSNPEENASCPLLVELRNCPFDRQKQIVLYILKRFGSRFRKASFDATGNGSYLAEALALKLGLLKIEQVKFSQQTYLDRFPRLKAMLTSGKLTMPFSEELVDDFMFIQLINGIPKPPINAKTTGKNGEPRHGDSCISLMLAISAMPRRIRGNPAQGSISYRKLT